MHDTVQSDRGIDLERLKHDVLELAEIGRNPEDRGIYRMAFTEADMEAKQWLRNRLDEVEIDNSMDGAGAKKESH